MKREYIRFFAFSIGLVFVFAACASSQPQVAVSAGQGEKIVSIQASNFKFEPNNLKATQGDTLVIKIVNVSDTEHNFTIKDPQGQQLQTVNLPPKQPVEVRISLPNTGEYGFYCDKPFHPTMGMTGKIQVVAK